MACGLPLGRFFAPRAGQALHDEVSQGSPGARGEHAEDNAEGEFRRLKPAEDGGFVGKELLKQAREQVDQQPQADDQAGPYGEADAARMYAQKRQRGAAVKACIGPFGLL